MNRPGRKSTLTLLTIVLLLTTVVEMAFAADVRKSWVQGEERTYTYRIGQVIIGSHSAKLVGEQDIPDLGQALLFEMSVLMDMSSLGQDFSVQLVCSLYCDVNGRPLKYSSRYSLGEDEAYVIGDVRDGAFSGRGTGTKIDSTFSIPVSEKTYLVDNNFVTQWELLLSNLRLNKRAQYDIDILIPQVLRSIPMRVKVLDAQTLTIAGKATTCSVVEVPMISNTFYIDPQGRLVRLVDGRQNLTVDLNMDGGAISTQAQAGGDFMSTLPRRLVIWAVYGIWTLILLLLFARKSLRRLDLWIVLIITGVSYWLIFLVQAPIQRELSGAVFKSIGSRGAGVYVAGLLAALVTGLVQATLKLAFVGGRAHLSDRKLPAKTLISLGIAAGAGFGLVEACWTTGWGYAVGKIALVSTPVWERIVTILFHAATGLMLGYGIAKKKALVFWVYVVVLQAVGSFFVVFLRQGTLSESGFEVLLTVYVALVAAAAWLLRERAKAR